MKHDEFSRKAPDGVDLYFQEWRPEDRARAVVCLVHGLGEHSGRYGHVAAHLNEAGYAVVAFDQRGHGRSGGPRGHSPSHTTTLDDIGLLLAEANARYPELQKHLYGHSLGGGMVINYALRRRPDIRSVIATSPALRQATPAPQWKTAFGKLLRDIRPEMQVSNGLDLSGISRDPEVIRAYRADPLVHDRVSARLGTDTLASGEWALVHAGEFPLPLLLIHGSADRITCPKASREFADHAGDCCTFVLLDGCYHETHNEPDAHLALDAITGWLDSHSQA